MIYTALGSPEQRSKNLTRRQNVKLGCSTILYGGYSLEEALDAHFGSRKWRDRYRNYIARCGVIEDGRKVWEYAAGGRIDSPPTIYQGLVLFGCRDGWVYCLRMSDGAVAWRFRAAPRDRLVVELQGVTRLAAHVQHAAFDGEDFARQHLGAPPDERGRTHQHERAGEGVERAGGRALDRKRGARRARLPCRACTG